MCHPVGVLGGQANNTNQTNPAANGAVMVTGACCRGVVRTVAAARVRPRVANPCKEFVAVHAVRRGRSVRRGRVVERGECHRWNNPAAIRA